MIKLATLKTSIAQHYYPFTSGHCVRGRFDAADTFTAKAGRAAVETGLLVPKLLLGTRPVSTRLSKYSGFEVERGALGCAAFAIGKATQYTCAGIGAGVGAVASAAGALFGCGGRHWVDRAAGKGWQVGTAVCAAIAVPVVVLQVALHVLAGILPDWAGEVAESTKNLLCASRHARAHAARIGGCTLDAILALAEAVIFAWAAPFVQLLEFEQELMDIAWFHPKYSELRSERFGTETVRAPESLLNNSSPLSVICALTP